jgi:hypothetical protein
MFVGHYAAAMAAKAVEPRAPFWTYVAGCQLIDIGWSVLVMAGVEKVSIDPTLPGSNLVLSYMPYTHSLPGALLWSLGAALLARYSLRLAWTASALVGLSVFSHWLLDCLVHRPDLELWFGGPRVGLALWNYPVPETIIEIGLVALGGAAWTAQRKAAGRTAWPALVFIALLVVLQLVSKATPGGSTSPASFALTALVLYLVVSAIGWLVDRRSGRARF